MTPAVEALGFELYGCEFQTQPHCSTLIVYIDSPKGVTLDDCVKASRSIGAVLDVEDPISGRYELEVSSPGIDRPLFTLPHYERVCGEKVKLRLRHARDNQRNFVGVLKAVAGDQITLLLDNGSERVLDFADVDKAKLISK
ncbi:MAG: hypothetical protein A3F41_00520 [Coxiella sp. RIFCSPHIGHO2_12_FULL_44_14]|nr:MAG: hypothetical protein A3F41_00520 [Coxiella sp. RIFCSPHIGHO2_12_FULL_44_14]